MAETIAQCRPGLACRHPGECLELCRVREEMALRDAGWQPMTTAPHDGTEILLLLYHPNRKYCRTQSQRAEWTAEVRAKWIDFNGGGFTWHGMFGEHMGWKPVPPLTVGSVSEN